MIHTGELNEYDCVNCLQNRSLHCTGGYYDTGGRWHCNSWDKIKKETAEKILDQIVEGLYEESKKEKNRMNPCIRCGNIPRIRYSMPLSWVKCSCGRRSKAFWDLYEQADPRARALAIEDWNKKNPEVNK